MPIVSEEDAVRARPREVRKHGHLTIAQLPDLTWVVVETTDVDD